MGRLFCKLFALLFLALVSTDIIVGNLVQWELNRELVAYQNSLHTPAAQLKVEPSHVLAQTLAHQHAPILFNLPVPVFILGILANLLFAGLLAWAIAHPIRLLLIHLKSAAEGDLLVRVSPKITATHDEFSGLGEAFDLMAIRLNNMIKSQSNMMHHVSHELRSPLARIQMAVGLAMQNPQKIQSSLQRVELEAVRMERMISELLEIFRFESDIHKLQKADVDLKALLTGIVGDVMFEKHDAKILLLMPDEPVIMDGQLELLQRAIDNVIRNALKYGPVNGKVTVELQHSARTGEIILEIQDQGRGVEPHELEQIFKPFVRGRRASQVEGHGIGLAMTKHIVEVHGGFVKATNLSPDGFMIRIHLPIQQDATQVIH